MSYRMSKAEVYSYHSKRIDCVIEHGGNFVYVVNLSVDGVLTEQVEHSFIEDARNTVRELVAQAYLDLDGPVSASKRSA